MTAFQVSRPVKWTVVGHEAEVPSIMSWSSEDPVAVKIPFGDTTGTIDWIFARDLLADVAFDRQKKAGYGDVVVEKHAGNIVLTLSVGSKTANLQADAGEIKAFLEATFVYIPLGKEEIDMDATIGRLLDGGWASGV